MSPFLRQLQPLLGIDGLPGQGEIVHGHEVSSSSHIDSQVHNVNIQDLHWAWACQESVHQLDFLPQLVVAMVGGDGHPACECGGI